MKRLAEGQSGGLVTFGVSGGALEQFGGPGLDPGALKGAYDITEGRPWWHVRLVAIGLTLGAALFILLALSLAAGPAPARQLGDGTRLGDPFQWAWLILQWPLAFALVSTVIPSSTHHFGPDADQDWAWVSPGALGATGLWLVASFGLKLYVSNFTDDNAADGRSGAIVLLLWLTHRHRHHSRAELNSEIEHASPYGKDPGEKTASGKRLLNAARRGPSKSASADAPSSGVRMKERTDESGGQRAPPVGLVGRCRARGTGDERCDEQSSKLSATHKRLTRRQVGPICRSNTFRCDSWDVPNLGSAMGSRTQDRKRGQPLRTLSVETRSLYRRIPEIGEPIGVHRSTAEVLHSAHGSRHDGSSRTRAGRPLR